MFTKNGDDFLSEVMIFFLLKVFALTFSGADFNLRYGDGISIYQPLIPAVDRLVGRLVASFKDGVVLDAILLLILGLFLFQLKEKGRASAKATLNSVTVIYYDLYNLGIQGLSRIFLET